MRAWLGLERNQVLYSRATGNYYFVPMAQRLGDGTTLRVHGKKVNVTSSVTPLVAYAVAGHLRELARSNAFDDRGRRKLLDAARQVVKKAGLDETDHEG